MTPSLFDIVFSPINISLTILLIIVFLYWMVTLVFGLDLDLDFDIDFDVDMDMEVDVDLDSTVGLDSPHLAPEDLANAQITKESIRPDHKRALKWWQIVLVFFNFVELPFMFTFTFWVLCWWFLTVFFTYLTGSYDNFFGFIIFLAAIIPALFLTRTLTTPFKRFFKKFEKNGEERLEIVGRTGVAVSNILGERIGSVKLVIENSPITIYGKSFNGEKINSGQEVLIIKESADKKYFYIQPYPSN